MNCHHALLATDTQLGWQERFLEMLPVITRQLRFYFRDLKPEERGELIQEGVVSALAAFRRLWLRGRIDLGYPTVLARYAARQIRAGRQTAERMNIKDLTSRYCQQRTGAKVERLDRFDAKTACWQQMVVADRRSRPADLAAFRIDFEEYLRTLTHKERSVALRLAHGESPSAVAEWLGVAPSRISQLRRKFEERWREFQGEASRSGVVAAS